MPEQKTEDKKPDEPRVSDILNSIQIALDDYNDIFSDFDFSEYNKRLISEDFLIEVQRRYYETKKGNIEVKFTLPAAARDVKTEAVIKRRLKQYFSGKTKDVDKDINKLRKRGAIHLVVGFVLLASELFTYDNSYLPIQLINVLVVPAGWYGMYSGLEHILDYPADMVEKRKFYQKFENAKYEFISEEDLLQQVGEASEQKTLLINPQTEQKDNAIKKEVKASP